MKSKIVLLMLCMILLVGTVSAFEFDNVKSYEDKTKTITIENAFGLGDEILSAQLDTPQMNYVGLGYQQVAQFTINPKQDYNDIIKEIKYYDLSNEEINIPVDIKYLSYKDVKKDDKENICNKPLLNGTVECYNVKVGTKIVQVEEWLPFENNVKLEEEVIIGLFTTTYEGQKVEWIPEVAGVKVNEWAGWEASLNSGLERWFMFEETSGSIVVDFNETLNGTSSGVGLQTPGIIGFGYNFSEGDYVNFTDVMLPATADFSFNLWVNLSATGTSYVISQETGFEIPNRVYGWMNASMFAFSVQDSGGFALLDFNTINWDDGDFHMVTIRRDGDNWTLSTDGVLKHILDEDMPIGQNHHTYIGKAGNFPSLYADVDEFGYWSRFITSEEVTLLYNSGLGNNPLNIIISPVVSVTHPANLSTSNSSSITFSGTASDDSAIINVSLYIDGVLNQTNSSGFNNSIYNFTVNMPEGTFDWFYSAWDDLSPPANTNSTGMRFTVDTLPKLSIHFPEAIVYNFTKPNQFNYTNDTLADWCWYSIDDGASNSTPVRCGINFTSVPTEVGSNTWNLWGNNTAGLVNGTSVTFTYNEFVEKVFFWNSTSFETASETFTINLTTNGTAPTNGELIYNGTAYGGATITNIAGDNYNISRRIDVHTVTGNKTFNFNFSLGGSEFSTSTRDQTVALLNYTFCITQQPVLNITFKNETIAEETVEATFDSDWFYWLGAGTTHKQLSFANASENLNYSFCLPGVGSRKLTANVSTIYGNSISQQRSFTNEFSLINGTTNQTLFLLPTVDGIFVTFQVVNTADQVLSGVSVNATKNGDIIGSGFTDDAGLITFFLNPNNAYTFTFTKEGFDTFVTTITPTQSSFTITLGGGVIIGDDFSKGISYQIDPKNATLQNNTVVTFNFNITSSFWDLEKYGFIIRNSTGTEFNTTSDITGTGGDLTILLDTSNNTDLIMDFFWLIEGNFSNSTRTWTVRDQTDLGFSVKTFFNDLSTYLNSGLFGLGSFGLGIIVFMIIFLVVGVFSSRFGITSPASISIMIFVLVLFFDVGIGIVPNPTEAIPNFMTIFIGLITLGVLVKEAIK